MNRKIVVALCMILLLIPIASADALNITAETYETFADNRSVNITINLTNSTTGNPINNTRVNFTTDLGILSTAYNYTNASGIAIVNISSWALGTANITAETPNATNATNVTFVAGPVSKIVLSSVLEAAVNTTCLITATVYDKTALQFNTEPRKWRMMPNVTLNFTVTSPSNITQNSPVEHYNASISPSPNTTDENGTATATLHLSSRVGGNVIEVNVTNEEGNRVAGYRTVYGLVGEPAYLFMSADPERVSANNIDTSQITGSTADEFLNPLCSLGSIRFNVTGNIVTMPLDWVGEATITIEPSKFTGTVTANGTYIDAVGNSTNIVNETVVEFYAEEPAKIIVAADATRISGLGIPGINESVITATVVDKWGHILRNRTVNLSTTLGSLSSTTAITNECGQATVTLQSNTAGDATVSVSTYNDSGYEIVGTIDIRIMDEPFISVITTIEPNPVEPGGIINVTTTISGQGNITGTRYAAHAMLALDRSGSMDPDYYAGTPLDIMLVTDVSGSMDPDYMNSGAFSMNGFTSYDYSANASVANGSWWNDTFVVNATPVNDFNTRLYWYAGDDDDLRLQLVSPSDLVYGYNGTASGYDYYNTSGELRECVWINLTTYSYPSSADTDTLEQGTWTVRVRNNNASASRSFDITTHIERLSAAKIASKEFNRNTVSNSRVGLISFGGDSGYGKRINTHSLSCNISYINGRSDALWAYGGTPTADAIQDAKNNLVNNQRSGARPYIILLSDGEPTIALDGSYGAAEATVDAISEAGITKNTVINGYDTKIYTIGFGTDASGNATMKNIASPGCYYYATTVDQLREIYYDIAQQISDFDITTRQYGVQGFTPYGYDAHNTVNGTFTDTFVINETINDFKVEIDNPNLNFTITSPSGTTYPDPAKGGYANRTGYYETDSGRYIWLTPLSGQYPLTDADTVEMGVWNITITGSGEFNITSYIDKKSAAKLASHAFISSLDPDREDRVGLTTYSYSSTNNTTVQSSYVQEGGQWEGYFTIVDHGGAANSSSWVVNSSGYPGNYLNSSNTTWNKTVSGASQIRVHFTEIDVEAGYDYVYIYDGGDNLVTSYTNTGSWPGDARTNVWTPWVDGDTIKIRLVTDEYVPGEWEGHYYSLSGFKTNLTETKEISPFTFSLTYPHPNNLTLSLYQGITLLNSSNTSIISMLDEDVTYHIIVNGTDVSSNDTNFTLTSSESVNWLEWRAQIDNPLNTSIGSFDPINSSIDSLTVDGMTAIDEGLLNANDALTGYENGTIVLMTDGIDNAGYHSMIAEAERAAARNTTIFTVGLGSDIDDGALEQIANITGGEYYFAPNATVLKSIFVGIAGELGDYTAPEPEINIYIGSNTTIDESFVNITYVSDSANVTYYNRTTERYEYEHPSNPDMTSIENRTILSWDVGNRPEPYMITVGKYWQVSYQLTIDNESANSIPVIIAPSSITYDDSNGTRINETIPEVTVTVGGNATPDISTDPATELKLSHEAESEGPPTRHPSSKPETIVEYAYKLTAKLTGVNESKGVAIGTLVEFRASSGTLYNHTYPESGNDTPLRAFNETTAAANNGGAVVWLCSDAPGTITVWAYHTPENGTRLNASRVVTFNSCEAPPIVPPAPEPRGGITLE